MSCLIASWPQWLWRDGRIGLAAAKWPWRGGHSKMAMANWSWQVVPFCPEEMFLSGIPFVDQPPWFSFAPILAFFHRVNYIFSV